MAYARPFGQQQAASPWSAGVPPGLPQQQQPPQAQAPAQQMFNQPMGPFDLSAGWQGQPQQASVPPPQVAAGQPMWAQQPMQAMQAPVQFVPNSGVFMQPPMAMHLQPQHQQRYQQQQRAPYHQRSLSAPRIGGGQNNKRAGNQNNSFGGGQRQFNNNNNGGNNNNNNNNANNQNQRTTRQQARQGNQKVQFSNNNNNNNNNGSNAKNNNSNNNNTKQQNQNQNQNQKQQQQQQQQQQQSKGPVKVTKAAKKQAVANANRGPVKNNNKANNSVTAGDKGKAEATDATGQQEPKPQSKTAERKQLKLQARKNAEALKKSSVPVVKSTKSAADKQADAKDEATIDQSQLKCVPAVFGFVCKVCDVFLRDRAARREHVELEEHLQKFKVFEEEQQKLAALKLEEVKSEPVEASDQVAPEQPDASAGEDAMVEETTATDATVEADAGADTEQNQESTVAS